MIGKDGASARSRRPAPDLPPASRRKADLCAGLAAGKINAPAAAAELFRRDGLSPGDGAMTDSIKTIAVHLPTAPLAARLLDTAIPLAERFGATLVGVHVLPAVVV